VAKLLKAFSPCSAFVALNAMGHKYLTFCDFWECRNLWGVMEGKLWAVGF